MSNEKTKLDQETERKIRELLEKENQQKTVITEKDIQEYLKTKK